MIWRGDFGLALLEGPDSLSKISVGDLGPSGGVTSMMKSKNGYTLLWKGLFYLTSMMR